ncbi:hypothetical protein [Kitasatospora kazusensis]
MASGAVLIRSGVPQAGTQPSGAGFPYPSSAIDMAKIIRASGFEVKFEHEKSSRNYISLHGADQWLPVIQVAHELIIATEAHILSDWIISLLGREKAHKDTLHIKYFVSMNDGTSKQLEMSGTGEDVLRALDTFEQDLRD